MTIEELLSTTDAYVSLDDAWISGTGDNLFTVYQRGYRQKRNRVLFRGTLSKAIDALLAATGNKDDKE